MKLLLPFALILAAATAFARDIYPPVDVLLQTETSVIGEALEYPDGTPQITMAIVTMQPGQKTGLHRHDAPALRRPQKVAAAQRRRPIEAFPDSRGRLRGLREQRRIRRRDRPRDQNPR